MFGRDINTLTKKQKEVVQLLESGMSQKEVAKKLGCTHQNVSLILKTIKKNKVARKKYEINLDEVDLNILSPREKEVILLKAKGMTNKQIAEKLKLSTGTVSNTFYNAKAKIEGRKTKNKKVKYEINLDEIDLSILSPREKEVIILRGKGKTYGQIAKELNLSTSSVGTMLSVARAKIEGRKTNWQKNREKINASYRASYKMPEKRKRKKAAREKFVKKHPEFKEKLKEYNKKYYQEHKEEILLRQRELKDEKRKYQE